jgi:GNAT superfamily N-acetyltransferase
VGVTIREGVDGDAPAMAEVNAAGWREGYKGIVDDEVLDHHLPVAQWKREMTDGLRSPRGSSFTWIAELDGEVCGYCFVAAPGRSQPDDSKLAELVAMYVRRHAWRGGVGSKLMEASLQRAAGAGFKEIFLRTFEENKRAIAFYKSHGFEAAGEKRPFVPYDIPTIRMARPLAQ